MLAAGLTCTYCFQKHAAAVLCQGGKDKVLVKCSRQADLIFKANYTET